MYTWTNHYSVNFIPDKYGRWGKTCTVNDLKIGEVIRIEGKYRMMTFFPMNAEDMPFVVETFDSWQDAKEQLEKLFGQFIQQIVWKP